MSARTRIHAAVNLDDAQARRLIVAGLLFTAAAIASLAIDPGTVIDSSTTASPCTTGQQREARTASAHHKSGPCAQDFDPATDSTRVYRLDDMDQWQRQALDVLEHDGASGRVRLNGREWRALNRVANALSGLAERSAPTDPPSSTR